MADTDVFGRSLLDWVQGSTIPEIVERDDGLTEPSAGPEVYLAPFREWPEAERKAVPHLRGRVLDVGCGAGRVAVHLQKRKVPVVGLDYSPRAVRAAKIHGVNEVWKAGIETVAQKITAFDSIVMFGNNFGIFGSPDNARRFLSEWASKAKPETRLFLESTDPYFGGAPSVDRRYFWRNKESGRPPGQARFRYHYGPYVGDWFDWLFVSRRDMLAIVRGTGWRVTEFIASRPSDPYVAILELQPVA